MVINQYISIIHGSGKYASCIWKKLRKERENRKVTWEERERGASTSRKRGLHGARRFGAWCMGWDI
jgi:hypothetical protein